MLGAKASIVSRSSSSLSACRRRAEALYCRALALFHLVCSSAVSLDRSLRGARLFLLK